MKIGRTLPPAAAPCGWLDLWHGAAGALRPNRSLQARISELRQEFGVAHVFPVSSGTAALKLTMTALASLSDASEVVIPAYTCFSVPAAVVHAGLRPVLCDIVDSTFDFDHALLPQTLTRQTLCVIAHHLFGIPSDIERTRAMCHSQGIFVVEDAAQALGVRRDGRPLGTLGDVGIFSFGRGKNVTCGSGGVVVTNSVRIAEAVEAHYRHLPSPRWWETIRDFVSTSLMMMFIRPRLYWIPAALPFLRLGTTVFPRNVVVKRLSGFKAGLLRNWRSRLARSNEARSAIAEDLRRRVPALATDGVSVPLLRLPVLAADCEEKARIYLSSKKRGLGMSPAYPTALNEVPDIRAELDNRRFPSAAKIASQLLTVPTHHWLVEEDKRAIAELCREFRSA